MKILGIETSCDETALSLIEVTEEAPLFKVLSTALISQIAIHAPYGGVFPVLAKREHGRNLVPLLYKILEESSMLSTTTKTARGITPQMKEKISAILTREQELVPLFLNFAENIQQPDIDSIAVTSGPGLEPALWVGISFAHALSVLWNIPCIPVNHMEGHIVASLFQKKSLVEATPLLTPSYPALALLISGGHTELILMKKWRHYERIGATRDDAVGEAFDKVARLLDLPYPGGPEISRLADAHTDSASASATSETNAEYALPRPMIHSKDFDFSFSGLKTAVLYMTRAIRAKNGGVLPEEAKRAIAHEFQNAATEVLCAKTERAIEEFGIQSLILGGGVIANKNIRAAFQKLADARSIPLFLPEISLSTDNALMIAIAGYFSFSDPDTSESHLSIHTPQVRAEGNLSL